ncbi:MAG: MmgE/PrpD family protein [Rhodospirillales bacterium]|nr:MmgE/PrpD family protein [Rhodospirillales bacterium]
MPKTLTEQLAAFVVGCDLAVIPKPVIERARLFVLDYLGVTLAGSSESSSLIIADVVKTLGGRETSTVIGHDFRTSAAMAALANGVMGHTIEMDDDHRTAAVHPAVAVIPAALAAAEHAKASGRAFLEGVIAGYELMTRIGDAFLGTQYHEGFHPTGTCGVFGAAAAAGRIFRLSETQLVQAFGIAGTQAAGLQEWKADGSWTKRLHPGKSAEAGILAAMLAKRGYTGPATILEGEHGFLKAFSFERKWDAAKITDGLGTEYRGHGTSFKPYAGCRFFHQVVDATLALVREHGIKPEQVADATVRVYRTAHITLFNPEERRRNPQTVVDAQFSIPYAVAVSILRGPPVAKHFTEKAIRDPEVLDLCRRVKGIPDEDYEKLYPARYPANVTIRLRDGREVSKYQDLPSGDPENPIYAEAGRFEREIEDKFRALLALQPKYAKLCDRMIARTKTVETLPNVAGLLTLFTPEAKAQPKRKSWTRTPRRTPSTRSSTTRSTRGTSRPRRSPSRKRSSRTRSR